MIWSHVGCPDSLILNLRQDAPARRPGSRVDLISTIAGVSVNEIFYYRWLIQETDEPLFTFSVIKFGVFVYKKCRFDILEDQ